MSDFDIDIVGSRADDIARALVTVPLGTARPVDGPLPDRAVNWPEDSASSGAWKRLREATPMAANPGAADAAMALDGIELKRTVEIYPPSGAVPVSHALTFRAFWDNLPNAVPEAPHLWIVAGSECALAATPAGGGARTDPVPFGYLSETTLARLSQRLRKDGQKPLRTVVLSIAGVEQLVAGCVTQDLKGRLLKPLDWLANDDVMAQLLRVALQGLPHLLELLNLLGAWQATDPKKRNFGLAPISANGFTRDDGMANLDALTGQPLLTCKGVIGSAGRRGSGGRTSFPADDKDIPEWAPFRTADPVLRFVGAGSRASALNGADFVKSMREAVRAAGE